jgi:Immunity protein 17
VAPGLGVDGADEGFVADVIDLLAGDRQRPDGHGDQVDDETSARSHNRARDGTLIGLGDPVRQAFCSCLSPLSCRSPFSEPTTMNPAGLIFVAAGIFSICGAVFDWDWFMNSRKARFFVTVFGRDGARIAYGILGFVIVILRLMLAIGAGQSAGSVLK